MSGNEIDGNQHVSRYCKPQCVGADGLPLGCAFDLRDQERYLSVNWLEYFEELCLAKAIDRVRQVFHDKGFKTARRGRFATLQVNQIELIISSLSPNPFRIMHLPSQNDPSHSGIYGYTATDKSIALRISALARAQDMYPAYRRLPSGSNGRLNGSR